MWVEELAIEGTARKERSACTLFPSMFSAPPMANALLLRPDSMRDGRLAYEL